MSKHKKHRKQVRNRAGDLQKVEQEKAQSGNNQEMKHDPNIMKEECTNKAHDGEETQSDVQNVREIGPDTKKNPAGKNGNGEVEKKEDQKNLLLSILEKKKDGITKSSFLLNLRLCILVGILLLIVLCIGFGRYFHKTVTASNEKLLISEQRIVELEMEKQQLLSQIGELQSQIKILSDAMNTKDEKLVAVEEENAKMVTPVGFPINSTASYVFSGNVLDNPDSSDSDQNKEVLKEQLSNGSVNERTAPEVEYIIIFEAQKGTNVIATANGTVKYIIEDSEYGHEIIVDHGNGYCSIYRNASEPKVKEKSEVVKGTVLFELEETQKIGYQIQLDGKYVNPEELMQIYG